MTSHRFAIVFALGSLCCSVLATLGGCSDDDPAVPAVGDPDGSAAEAGSGTDSGGATNDGGPSDGSTGSSTAPLIPTDGGPYFVAAVDGTPHSFMFNVMATRSAGAFVTIRSAAGLTLPTRDLEIRMPKTVGPAACDGTTLSTAGIVLRTSDMGGLSTGADGTSCSFDVTGASTGAGERMKGTFSGTVKSDTGTTATITEGAFDIPTIN